MCVLASSVVICTAYLQRIHEKDTKRPVADDLDRNREARGRHPGQTQRRPVAETLNTQKRTVAKIRANKKEAHAQLEPK